MKSSDLRLTPDQRKNPQWAAALFIFDHIGLGHEFVFDGSIDGAGLLEEAEAWSHGERVMIKIALDLFAPGNVRRNGREPAGWGETANLLDPTNLEVVWEAIRIVRGEVPLPLL